MDIYVFSDESGVFDCKHHEWFVYAGIIVVGKYEMDSLARSYIAIEKNLRKNPKYRTVPELKGAFLDDKSRRKLLTVFSDTMKYAIIGCGRISPNHIEAAKNNGLDIAAICDIDENAMAEKAEKFSLGRDVRRYADYRDLLVAEKPELVAIATESGKHAKIALDCIEKNVNIIIEKPIALSQKDADIIIEKSKEKATENYFNSFFYYFNTNLLIKIIPAIIIASELIAIITYEIVFVVVPVGGTIVTLSDTESSSSDVLESLGT